MLEWIIHGLKTVSKQSARGMRNSLCWWKQNTFVICKTMQVTTYYDNQKNCFPANHMILLMSIHLILAIVDLIPCIDEFTSYNCPSHDHSIPKILWIDNKTLKQESKTRTVILLIFKRQPFEGFVSTVSVMIALFTSLPSKTKSSDDRCTRSMLNSSKSKKLIDLTLLNRFDKIDHIASLLNTCVFNQYALREL